MLSLAGTRMDRRYFMAGGISLVAVGLSASAAGARQLVEGARAPAGIVLIDNRTRRLIFGLGGGQAIAYPVAIGRAGRNWVGQTSIVRKEPNPIWQPPEIVRRDSPHLPRVVPPGPTNPLGTRALVLARPEYAIHGTNAPHTIGTAASYGCFRMFNRDVEDLFERVHVGTPVVVV